jgi:hypothetical protein
LSLQAAQPHAGHFTDNWSIFRLWGRPRFLAGDCASPPPANDELTQAEPVPANAIDASYTASGTLVCATIDPGENELRAANGLGPLASSVWYEWTQNDETLPGFVSAFSTDAANPDPSLTLWQGSPASGFAGLSLFDSRDSFQAGTTYLAEVGQGDGVAAAPTFDVEWVGACF